MRPPAPRANVSCRESGKLCLDRLPAEPPDRLSVPARVKTLKPRGVDEGRSLSALVTAAVRRDLDRSADPTA